MKYEARMPSGEIIGTVELPDEGHRFISMHIVQNLSLRDFIDTNQSTIGVKTVEFEVTCLRWKYRSNETTVPTAILTRGKKSWLRGQSWYRGLR